MRLLTLIPSIKQICKDEGISGVSIGVLHRGETLWTEGFGFRNQAKTVLTDSETLYGIGNLTMSMVAAGIGKLVDGGNFDWNTPVKEILPEFWNVDTTFACEVTIADLLSHRSGLNGNAEFRLASHGNGEVLLSPDQLFEAIKIMPCLAPIRSTWKMCPWGYSIAGHIVTKVTQQPLHEYLKDQIFGPLGMEATTLRPSFVEHTNLANPDTSLTNVDTNPLANRLQSEDTIFQGSCGAYSSVNDLLIWAKATLAASESIQIDAASTLKQIPHIVSNQIAIANPSLLERSYGFGWARTQLPGRVGLTGDNKDLWDISEQPVLGAGSQSRLMIYHQGGDAGYSSFHAIFPETKSAVVVLTNTTSVSDAADWIGRTLIDGLFNFSNPVDHVSLAAQARIRRIEQFRALQETLTKERNNGTTPLPLGCYVGKYINNDYKFMLEITLDPNSERDLILCFQGRPSQSYNLRHYHDHVFEWSLSYDEVKKRGRPNITDPSYYKIQFEIYPDKRASKIIWQLEDSSLPKGLTFMWKDEKLAEAWRAVHKGMEKKQDDSIKFANDLWCRRYRYK
ncbi:uncharacterized protein N7529_009063 [Penicillium soppii]|uniref:uncharacterized protein n=1 Tax=Penicillium soppii TaxID=69789 RepID=UPI0025481D7C|nr:uncharacterized protein N7529_009063 [Penicillium soppii]KAJ5861753.1 hypothetical protein N7529_009063 [Penicillium soppii]